MDFKVRAGVFGVLVGPSGCGKTTLLQGAAGLLAVEPLPALLRDLPEPIALLSTRPALLLAWSALDNAALRARIDGLDRAEARQRAAAALERLGCAHLVDLSAARLSDGERVRVALAGMLARQAPTLLLDEPTASLDAAAAAVVAHALVEEASRGRTIIAATHDPALADLASERLDLGSVPDAGRGRALSPARTRPSLLLLSSLAMELSKGARARLAGAALAGALLLGLLVASVGLGTVLRTTAVDELLGAVSPGGLRVTTPTLTLGPLQLSLGAVSVQLDDAVLAEIAALPDVAAVHPQIFADFPASARISLGGVGLSTDLILEGVTASWLAEDVDKDEFRWTPSGSESVPVVLSEQLLVLYNLGFAGAHGLPRLDPRAVIGLRAEATLGRSSFARSGEAVTADARIIGVSRRVAPVGATVPAEFVRHVSERLHGRLPPWTSAVVQPAESADTLQLTRELEELGLRVDDEGGDRSIGRAAALIDATAKGGAAVLFLAAAALLSLVLLGRVEGRKWELDALEFAGLSRGGLTLLATAEAVVTATLAAIGALVLASIAGGVAGRALTRMALEQLGLRLHEPFVLPALAVTVVIALVPLVAVLIAARTSARLSTPLLERGRPG